MAQTIRDRIDAPDETSDGREIWMIIRSWITIIRIFLVFAIIIVAEIFEEHSLLNISLSVWAIVVGFPLLTSVIFQSQFS